MSDGNFWLGFVCGGITGACLLCLAVIWAAQREGG